MANWFASPAALWLGLLIGPLLLLYMLRHKPVKKRVASTMLWVGVARAQIATSPFQRIRKSLSLFLMLLALIALVLALAGFRIPGGETRGLPLTIVIDVTASMGADEIGGTRLDRARERADEVIDAAGNSDVTVLVWDGALRSATPGDVEPAVASGALDEIETVPYGASDAALVRAMERIAEDSERRVVLVSDHSPGGFDGNVLVVPAALPKLNAGVVSASLTEVSARQVDLFFGVELTGTDKAVTVPFRLERVLPDGKLELFDAKDVTLEPNKRSSVNFTAMQPGLYRGQIKFEDALELDNAAYLRFSELPLQEVVLTPGTPAAIEKAAEAIADGMGIIRLVPPGAENRETATYVLADSASAGAQPRLPSVYLAPSAPPPGLSFGEVMDVPDGVTRPTSTFLWRGVGTPDIRIAKVYDYSTDGYARPVLQAGGGTAIALLPRENELADLLIAAPLDKGAEGFTGKFAFVIFWANWFDYVRRNRDTLPRGAITTRETVRVRPGLTREQFQYGTVTDAELVEGRVGVPLEVDDIGVYRFEGLDDTSLPLIGVSLLDATESNLAGASIEDYDTEFMREWMADFKGEGETRDLELGPWLALLVAVLLLFDWYWFRRRFPTRAAPETPQPKTRSSTTRSTVRVRA